MQSIVFFVILEERNERLEKKMKYSRYTFEKLIKNINDEGIISLCKKAPQNFTRQRKIGARELIVYNLNKKGLTTKMELEDFIVECNIEDVSSPALLKQREKLNPEVFKYLHNDNLKAFYNQFSSEVKTFKGHILAAIDGSDWEIPNTQYARGAYNAQKNQYTSIARMKVSNCFDVLNCYVLDTQIESNKFNELELAKRHLKVAKTLTGQFPLIRIMDRYYNSLSEVYHSLKNNDSFVVRLQSKFSKKDQEKMKSHDEWIELSYETNRIRYWKDKDSELYEFYENGNTLKVRLVKIELKTGETEVLMTNLKEEDFTCEDIAHIYKMRWGIETNYHYLKESMKMTNISSGKKDIIKQEIFSQMLVFNMLQSLINEAEQEIDQSKYKHKMKININMAVGYLKRFFIVILLEENLKKRQELSETLHNKILKQIVPIRGDRDYARNKSTSNKHPITKRKAF
jgi:hypothetical protein